MYGLWNVKKGKWVTIGVYDPDGCDFFDDEELLDSVLCFKKVEQAERLKERSYFVHQDDVDVRKIK